MGYTGKDTFWIISTKYIGTKTPHSGILPGNGIPAGRRPRENSFMLNRVKEILFFSEAEPFMCSTGLIAKLLFTKVKLNLMKRLINMLLVVAVAVFLSSCAVIREGEVGVKRKFGKYSDKPYTEGLKMFNPLTSTVVKIPVRTENLEVGLRIPSKEGLNVGAEISILYNVIPKDAPDLLRRVGTDYERNVILPVFRSAIADVSSKYFAKDMHTNQRGVIETDIQQQMTELLDGKGITIEAVLFKSIQLPPNLARAIEEKLEAEQQALRMEFVLQEARQEAERRRIEAEGVRDAQQIIAEGLNAEVLQFKSIEAFLELAKSPNTKIIVSDGDMPVLLTPMNEAGSANSGRTQSVPSNLRTSSGNE